MVLDARNRNIWDLGEVTIQSLLVIFSLFLHLTISPPLVSEYRISSNRGPGFYLNIMVLIPIFCLLVIKLPC